MLVEHPCAWGACRARIHPQQELGAHPTSPAPAQDFAQAPGAPAKANKPNTRAAPPCFSRERLRRIASSHSACRGALLISQTIAVRVEIRSGLEASHLRWLLSDLSELTGVRPGTGVLWRVCVCESEAETRGKGAPPTCSTLEQKPRLLWVLGVKGRASRLLNVASVLSKPLRRGRNCLGFTSFSFKSRA